MIDLLYLLLLFFLTTNSLSNAYASLYHSNINSITSSNGKLSLPSSNRQSKRDKSFPLYITASNPTTQSQSISWVQKNWPCNDVLDQRILKIALPAILNFAIIPLVGAVDTFWVGRMGNPLALAGQGASNQVFSSTFWIISFLPSVVTPLVAKAAGANDKEKIQKHVSEAIFLGLFMGIFGTFLLTTFTDKVLGLVLAPEAASKVYARSYLWIRAITFIPSLLSTVGFAAFRGTMDVVTPLKIAIVSNLINLILDPLLIFKFGLGVSGAAVATCVAEFISFLSYGKKLLEKQMLNANRLINIPSFEALKPLLFGGLSVQLRAVAMNIAFLAVTRTTQALDTTGITASAHAITVQFWQLGGIFLLAMSTVASIIVPTEHAKAKALNTPEALWNSRRVANRLLAWGVLLGIFLAFGQLLCLPLLKVFTPVKEVQDAARLPAIIGAGLQILNGVLFIGEGIQQGNQYFTSLAVCTSIATSGMLLSLKYFGNTLAGVWGSFAVFNTIRLLGILRHHYIDGPFAPRKLPPKPIEKVQTSNSEKGSSPAFSAA